MAGWVAARLAARVVRLHGCTLARVVRLQAKSDACRRPMDVGAGARLAIKLAIDKPVAAAAWLAIKRVIDKSAA